MKALLKLLKMMNDLNWISLESINEFQRGRLIYEIHTQKNTKLLLSMYRPEFLINSTELMAWQVNLAERSEVVVVYRVAHKSWYKTLECFRTFLSYHIFMKFSPYVLYTFGSIKKIKMIFNCCYTKNLPKRTQRGLVVTLHKWNSVVSKVSKSTGITQNFV